MRLEKFRYIVTNHDVDIWPLCMLLEMLQTQFPKHYGISYGPIAGVWQNSVNRMAAELDKRNRITLWAHKRVEKDPAWAFSELRALKLAAKQLIDFTNQHIWRKDLATLSNKALATLLERYRRKFFALYVPGWLPNVLEGDGTVFSKRLEESVRTYFSRNTAASLALLMTPRRITIRLREAQIVFNFSRLISKQPPSDWKALPVSLQRKLQLIHRRYNWLEFDYHGPGYSMSDLWSRVCAYRTQRNNRSPLHLYRKQLQAGSKLLTRIKDGRLRRSIQLAQELMFWKAERKDRLYQSYAHSDKLIEEIARRMALTKRQVRHLVHKEILDLLMGKKVDVDAVNQRIQFSVVIADKKLRVYTGKEAERLVARIPDATSVAAGILHGQTAMPGRAVGIVCVVNARVDIGKMRSGMVLVSEKTNPSLLQAMRLAAAIVTEQGGVTSHAAIVARELGIPCVIGTKMATKVLSDGDMVEVDATKGVVTKL